MHHDISRLFNAHAAEIARQLRRRGVSADVAADLTQDAFVRFMTQYGTQTDIENPRALLRKISINLGVDFERRRRLAPRAELTETAFVSLADPSPTAERVLGGRQTLAIIEAALAELPERTQRAFDLYRLHDLTIAQTAVELGLSTTRTWGLIQQAQTHIRDRLGQSQEPTRPDVAELMERPAVCSSRLSWSAIRAPRNEGAG